MRVQVFSKYNSLLMSENYVTRRQSLKLLGEILLDRSNFDIMMKYIRYVRVCLCVCVHGGSCVCVHED